MNQHAPIDDTTRRLMQNLVLDMLQTAMQQAGVSMSPESRTGMQALRDLVNGKSHAPDRPLATSATLLPVLQKLMQQMAGGDQARCQPNADASRWAPRDSLRAWGNFFNGLADGMRLASQCIPGALGQTIH